MKIILNNGAELTPLAITGGMKPVQGAQRDTLHFVFPAESGLDTLDAAFTESACENITITGDDESENLYHGYTIRAGLVKASVEVTPATAEAAAVYEDRITVSMSQRTYAESQLLMLTSAVNTLLTGEVE